MEIYVSTDIEADGPIPGPNSMLSFGSAAFYPDKRMIGTFSANLELLPEALPDDNTTDFWAKNQEAYNKTRLNVQDQSQAMHKYVNWLDDLPGKPVFVGYPASYDFLFVYWYLRKFVGRSPFSHSALDIKTYAMAMMKKDFRYSTKRNMPRNWFDESPHTHVAIDDAVEQGKLFCNMLAENTKTK